MGAWLEAAQALRPDLVALRRALHAEPELSFEEHGTAARVETELRAMGLEPRRLTATGVVAELAGGRPGPTVAIRADMDALPIQEATQAPYASRRPGVMHACGHDAHTTVALGAARLLAARRAELAGCVRLIFQPGEETPPGGARDLVAAGAVAGVAAIVGLHQLVNYRAGQVAVCAGPFLAACDEFRVRIRTRGGGASNPHRGTDGILLAAQVITGLQSIVSRRINPVDSAVLSVGTIHGGTKANVLANAVHFSGIAYAHNPEVRAQFPGLIRQLLEGVLHGQAAEFDLEYSPGYPPLHNDPGVAAAVRAAAVAELREGAVLVAPPVVAADDMAYYLGEVPGCYFLLGIGNPEQGITAPAHTPTFDIDEDALPVGAAVLAASAWRLLAAGAAG